MLNIFKNYSSSNKYNKELRHIQGNAATGEQVSITRNYQTDKPMTVEEMEAHYEDMNQEAQQWRANNQWQSADFITSSDVNGNQITEIIPARDLVFFGSDLVAIYDQSGKKIVGQNNIRNEIQRRKAQWEQWKRQGELENIANEIHHTNDGWTSTVTFEAAPEKLHPNEVNTETERLIRFAAEKRQRQLENSNDQEFSEEAPRLLDISSKKSKIEENEGTSSRQIDSSVENSPKPISNDLLTDDEVTKASSERIFNELESRKSKKGSTSDEQLEQQSYHRHHRFSTSPNNYKPQPSNGILPVLGLVSLAVLFGGLIIWKKKKKR